MESIVKLRRYVYDTLTKSAAYAINDMIDEVERDVAELTDERDLLKRQWEAGVDFDQRLEACAESREDVTLFGVDYTPLPVDADGVPINVGDVMEADNGTTFEVEHISLYQWGWRCVGEGTDRSGVTCTAHAIPDGCRHHHAPTVEDMLREFVERLDEIGSEDDCAGVEEQECRACIRRDIAAVYAEYAARLRLAGEDE